MANALTIPEWFLVIVLGGHMDTGLVPVQRFESELRCEQQLAVEATVQQLRGQEIISAHCQRVRSPRAAR